MTEEISVDCLVIGAGPAGSITAREVSRGGWEVLMIEKRAEIGVPVRCGEGISKQLLEMIGLERDGRFIDSEMDGAKIHSPSGHTIELGPEIAGPEVGFVIKREYFDQRLAEEAVRAGSRVWVRAEAMSMEKGEDGYIVDVDHISGKKHISAKVIVAADGFASKVGRWAGMDTSLKLKDIDTCIQYEMVGVDVVERYTEFFLGSKIAPGGYIWCFPKDSDTANVGIGINGAMIDGPSAAKRYLDSFIENNERFAKGKITEINGGGVSVSLPLEETVSDHLVVVGDAARMIDPLTGGGIYNSCFAGIQAGRTICEALERGNTSKASLEIYDTRWREGLETEMARNYLAKEKLLEVSDEILDKVISAVSEYDLKEISTEELLKAVSSKYPEVMEELGRLI
ncbi:MAG: NAD(P)/FAD-dependent oxidoreductase [Candidatus Thermoplasmatota archaeon]|nr:NAD(P)/FAD-dependent oxidoreductase [Candidatus Thermoplasmatota archaeon]